MVYIEGESHVVLESTVVDGLHWSVFAMAQHYRELRDMSVGSPG